MRHLKIQLVVLFYLLIVSGCFDAMRYQESDNVICYEELTKETFQKLDVSEVVSVEVVSTAGKEPHKWRRIYRNVFPIRDSRIETIYGLIQDGGLWDYYTDRYILFTTEDRIYYMGIGWTDETAYGNWWNSPELRKLFREWGDQRPKSKKAPETITGPPRRRRGMPERKE